MTKKDRENKVKTIKSMSTGQIIDFIIAKTRKKKDFHKRFKKAEIQLKDLEEEIKIAENIKTLREAGNDEQMSLF